jgi:hypothetical protein
MSADNGARQKRRPVRRAAPAGGAGAGTGVDIYGAPVIDPTENVLALVDVEKSHAKELREADAKYFGLSIQCQKDAAAAETRRVNDLAELKERYDSKISDINTVQVKTTSELISTQLDKVTGNLASQIDKMTGNLGTQITGLTTTFNAAISEIRNSLGDRISQLERFRYEIGGKTSVSDPALAEAMQALSAAVRKQEQVTTQASGRSVGHGEIVSWVFAGVMALAAIAAIAVALHLGK